MGLEGGEGAILLGAVSTVFGLGASIIAYFAKRHYADLDRKNEEHGAEIRMLKESVHALQVQLARNETIADRLERIERVVTKLSDELYTVRPPVGRSTRR